MCMCVLPVTQHIVLNTLFAEHCHGDEWYVMEEFMIQKVKYHRW